MLVGYARVATAEQNPDQVDRMDFPPIILKSLCTATTTVAAAACIDVPARACRFNLPQTLETA